MYVNTQPNQFTYLTLFIGAASRSVALQHEIVQRSMCQFFDHNYEEMDGYFTRPTLDLYIANRYWNFITKNLQEEEIADLQKARENLAHFEKLYAIMEYGADLNGILTTLETRVASNNPSIPLTIYRQVSIYQYFNP